jgi:hypothetical protein
VKKKYDPLWEIVDEKVSLQDAERHLDVVCPHCHVTVHLPADAKTGSRFCCGLCGALWEVTQASCAGPLDAAEITQRHD